ncbi:dihydrofolate reductase family protein [Streptomyces sp. ID05-04B]|uniref:dihydrofolate reductase family protein n=1 Tax=unclassified Streptomyces TaxID=2593676 RepID=UPI000D1BC87E|nr:MULTISPECIES: dihydrofolate reductase family protein [unclassified Streptomyces]AVV40762.1 deaminase [Streptomyces sp. P3]MDX5564940.1 dihydrofolate reductase family protein [Streptomyces sp. ID05-04B]
MRKIVLMMSVSLDGYIEGPGHDISWHRVDEELHRHMNDVVRGLGGLLSGRITHELMAGFWPTFDSGPDVDPDGAMAEFAGIWREIPKYVYSRTLQHADWNTVIVREVVPDEVRALSRQPGGDLGLGGADLAAAFLDHDLVDEIRLYVHPVLIGRGKPLFPHRDALTPLTLVESHTFGNGVVLLHYQRASEEGEQTDGETPPA